MQKNIIMDIIKKLPSCLKKKIFLFDNTYHRIYKNKVINEFKNKTGYWWFVLIRKKDNYDCLYSPIFDKKDGLQKENRDYIEYCFFKEWQSHENITGITDFKNKYNLVLSYYSDFRIRNPYFHYNNKNIKKYKFCKLLIK